MKKRRLPANATESDFEDFYRESDPWQIENSPWEKYRSKIISEVLKEKQFTSALDIGCGEGTFTRKLQNCESISAFDISKQAIARAKLSNSESTMSKIDYFVEDLAKFKAKDKFDLIICLETIYYLPSFALRQEALREISLSGSDDCTYLISLTLNEEINDRSHFNLQSAREFLHREFSILNEIPINFDVISSFRYSSVVSRLWSVVGLASPTLLRSLEKFLIFSTKSVSERCVNQMLFVLEKATHEQTL